jgi:hypothetical protein
LYEYYVYGNFGTGTYNEIDYKNIANPQYIIGSALNYYTNSSNFNISDNNDFILYLKSNLTFYNVTFNILDNNTMTNINNFTISCNNSFINSSLNSPFTHEFLEDCYNCSYIHALYNYTDNQFCINSDYNQTILLYLTPIYYNITFNILDNETFENLNNITINCNNSYNKTISSPFIKEFLDGCYNCSYIKSGYYYNETQFCNNNNHNETIFLTIIPSFPNFIAEWTNLSCCQINDEWTTFTLSKCLDNNKLYQEYKETKCNYNQCQNYTKFRFTNCIYGCGTEINTYGDSCLQPNWIIYLIIIIVIVIIIIFLNWIWKK